MAKSWENHEYILTKNQKKSKESVEYYLKKNINYQHKLKEK